MRQTVETRPWLLRSLSPPYKGGGFQRTTTATHEQSPLGGKVPPLDEVEWG